MTSGHQDGLVYDTRLTSQDGSILPWFMAPDQQVKTGQGVSPLPVERLEVDGEGGERDLGEQQAAHPEVLPCRHMRVGHELVADRHADARRHL